MHQRCQVDGALGEVWHSESWTAYEALDTKSCVLGHLLLTCPALHVQEKAETQASLRAPLLRAGTLRC